MSEQRVPFDDLESFGTRVDPDRPPAVIGHYRILRKLGEGGMGVVYEAEQQQPRRAVALKVIRGGRYVDEATIRLFQREAQALGRLKHPAIASIYESGRTEDGQHFFAMELVRGEKLGDWLGRRESQKMTATELRIRLELFCKICEPVAYAHQRGVVHRDLKPSNILVRGEPEWVGAVFRTAGIEIKVLDFGLAKIAETDIAVATVVTEMGRVQGTLPYMSPEQVQGNADEIDLRTDIYSLGVVLYEMLTGRYPYHMQKTGIIEAARAIREDPPAPLATVWKGQRRPDRDIETIVHKALEKDPARRYPSVSALADDVARHLAHQPIQARPPRAMYQLRKMVKRHTVAFAGAAALVVLLAAFAVVTTLQGRRIRAAAERVNVEARTADVTVQFLTKLFQESDPNQARGATITARELLDRGARNILELEEQPRVQATLKHVIGTVYADLGLLQDARPLLEDALRVRREVLGERHLDTARSQQALAHVLASQDVRQRPRELLEQALATRMELLGPRHPEVAATLTSIAAPLMRGDERDREEALRLQLRALEIREEAYDAYDENVQQSLNNIAWLHLRAGRFDQAQSSLERSLEILTAKHGPNHTDVALVQGNLAYAYWASGDHEKGLQLQRQALETRVRLHGENDYRVLLSRASLAAAEGDEARAIELLRESIRRGLASPTSVLNDWHLAGLQGTEPFDEIVRSMVAATLEKP